MGKKKKVVNNEVSIGYIDPKKPTPQGTIFSIVVEVGETDPWDRTPCHPGEAVYDVRLDGYEGDGGLLRIVETETADVLTLSIGGWNKHFAPVVVGKLAPGTEAGKSKIENPSGLAVASGKSEIAPPPRADRVFVSVKDIEVKDNIRSSMDEDSLFELADSMKAVGLLSAVIVHKVGKKLVMIAGHRRLAAAKENDEDLIKAEVYDTLDAEMVARMQLTENLQREDLNHIDIARQLGVARDAGMTNAEIAAEINTSNDYVRKHLDLLRLTGPVADLVASGRLPVKQAELIARVGDPKQQIDLAGRTVKLDWHGEPKGWQSSWASDDPSGKDYVRPMEGLRTNVAYVMQGLAAVGWPMGEKFAGKRPCRNCPDNTATYADQPALFAGINPRGSDKKGHCTNEACYKAKTVAQNIVREDRRKEGEKKTAANIAKAKKAGLSVCEACTKVSEPNELTEFQGQMLCAKCVEKQQKKTERDSHEHGGESYQQREKRVKALKKKFPWNAEQKFAVALHNYGIFLADAIGESLNEFAPPDAEKIILLTVAHAGDGFWLDWEESDLLPTLAKLIKGGQFPPKALAILWGRAHFAAENQPGVARDADVENVPLSVGQTNYIDGIEALAKHWGMEDMPTRPTEESIAHGEFVKVILKGKKPEALAAIAACENVGTLESILDGAVKLAVWRMNACISRRDELKGKAEPPLTCQGKTKRSPKKKAKAKGIATSRVNENHVLTDTERIEVEVPGTKRVKLLVEVALAPDGYWYRGVSVVCGNSSFSYSPSIQKAGHESCAEAIVAGLHEIANHLRGVSDRGTASKAEEAEITKAIAAVKARLTVLSPTPEPAAETEASEQLGQINEKTPLGRKFEINMPDAEDQPRYLTLMKWTAKEYAFLDGEGNAVKLLRQLWENTWQPNCTGYTDMKKDSWTIIHGKKPDALAAIAACVDLKGLKMFVGFDNVLKGDWRRAAVRTRIEKLEKELATDGKEKED